MRSTKNTPTMNFKLPWCLCLLVLLSGCDFGSSAGKAVGLSKRPWLYPVQEFSPEEKAHFAAAKNVIWTDLPKDPKDPKSKPDGVVQLGELSLGKNPVLDKLQRNFLALKAQHSVYMAEAWKVNMAQLDALGWPKSDSEYALINELIKAGYSEDQIDKIKKGDTEKVVSADGRKAEKD